MQEDNLYNLRHSTAHLLAAAVLELWPDAKLGVGPVIENGFYYDFELGYTLTDKDFAKIEKRMHKLASLGNGFEKEELSIADAKAKVKEANQPFKLELIEAIEETGSAAITDSENASGETDDSNNQVNTVTFYHTGKFVDLCRGGHIENTKEIKHFKLLKVAGAYWRGNENNPQLQRIYGTVWSTREELENYLHLLEEAKARDHRKLGKELDLFVFSSLVGGGLPLFTPKGTTIRNLLDNFVWDLRSKYGYQRVDIPHLAKKALYETSGHWDKFGDDLFKIVSRDNHEYVMKPMNCPHHIQIFDRKPRSYKELPVRYANTTKVYRDEQSGELAGLSRVLSITQDDAHIFCRESQMQAEILAVTDIVSDFYGRFGFDLRLRLSFHNPKNKENYLGDSAIWEQAESALEDIAKQKGLDYFIALGEASFYGPKIDFIAKDSLGRDWQVATIQLDMNLPHRFNLSCIDENGDKEEIVMIHAAIMGSIERFMAIMLEHTAGKLPLWLAPVQVKVLAISDKHQDYAREVEATLLQNGFRVEIDLRSESIGKKIRSAQIEKVPYMVIVGDKELESKSVSLRSREQGDVGSKSLKDFVEFLQSHK